jgi:hypothetical protein
MAAVSGPVPILALLAEAGDLQAPEGSHQHDLARAHAVVAGLIAALRMSDDWIREASERSGIGAAVTLDCNRIALAQAGATA